jgi:hypothetical protein
LGREKPDLAEIEKKLHFLKSLKGSGYALTCEDDGSVSCEIQLPKAEIESEVERITEAS